jgi:hypothetical protein
VSLTPRSISNFKKKEKEKKMPWLKFLQMFDEPIDMQVYAPLCESTNQTEYASLWQRANQAHAKAGEALTNQLESVDVSINALRGYRRTAQSFSLSDAGSDASSVQGKGETADAYCTKDASEQPADFCGHVDLVRKNVALAEAELDRFAQSKRAERSAIEQFNNIELKHTSLFSRVFHEIHSSLMDQSISDAVARYMRPPKENLLTAH